MSGINSLFSTALSGLNAAGAIVGTAASNIANLDSKSYKAARVNLANAPQNAGVQVASITSDLSTGALDEQGQELSNVDLPTELVNLRQGEILYNANAAVVRVGYELSGTLLDMMDSDHRRPV
jgi:flagellar hook-associated protein FlgK